MKNLNYVLVIVIIIISNSFCNAQFYQVKSKVYTLPVIHDQSINVVKKYVISSNEDKKSVAVNFTLGIDKKYKEVINSISIYQSKNDTTLLKENNKSKYKHINTIKAKNGKNKILANLDLKKGNNYIWVSIQVKQVKNLLSELKLTYSNFLIDNKIYAIDDEFSSTHRFGVAVRRHKQDDVHTSRIPGIITAKDGSLVSVYDARYELGRDLQGHMDIGVSRSLDKGLTWLPIEVAIDMGEFGGLAQKWNGVSDPNILLDENTGDIYVAGLWMHGVIDENGTWYPGVKDGKEIWNHQWKTKGSQPGFDIKQTSQFLIVKSKDNGKTWSKPINLTKMCKQEDWWLWAPAPGHGITLKDGTLVFPTQGRDHSGKAFSNITYSKDGGKSWKTSNSALSRSTTECMAVELKDGSIMLNMRSNLNATEKGENNGRAIATTSDLGNSWSEHPTSHNALIEPTCMASIHKHHYKENGVEKSILIFCNPDSKFERINITIKVSDDDGITWKTKKLLDEGKGRGYSCITSIDENTIGILYESSQADLVFQQITLKDLL